jgi:uncharacterized protein
MIAALADLYAASGNPDFLAQAQRSAEWVLANRALPNGGFRHDEKDRGGPYLGDTLTMGQAFLTLYQVTAEARWLDHAKATLPFIAANFASTDKIGYLTSKAPTDRFSHTFPERDENIALARFTNLLYQYTGDTEAQTIASQTMRYLVTPAIAIRPLSAGELLAIDESINTPLHITVVGPKEDPAARQLFMTALSSIRSYERLEWLPDAQSADTHNEVSYPALTKPAAFFCHENLCGDPIYLAQTLTALIARAYANTKPGSGE